MPGVHGVVVDAERAGPLATLVPEERDRPARREGARDPLVSVLAAHPVPRLRGIHQAEPSGRWLPRLEQDLLGLDAFGAQDRGHCRARLQGVDPETARGEARGCLARSGTDLERAVARVQFTEFDDRVEQRVGIRRAILVVLLGDLAEHQALFALGCTHRGEPDSHTRHASRNCARRARPSSPGGGGHHARHAASTSSSVGSSSPSRRRRTIPTATRRRSSAFNRSCSLTVCTTPATKAASCTARETRIGSASAPQCARSALRKRRSSKPRPVLGWC